MDFLGVEDPEIIPGNTLSKHTGPWNHTKQYTIQEPDIIPGNILSAGSVFKLYTSIYVFEKTQPEFTQDVHVVMLEVFQIRFHTRIPICKQLPQ